jgi:histone acetyltransferase (RNA polymerase elongator complex component)
MKEPGVLRANRFNFDCVKQFRDRCKTYYDLGHPVDKIEVIVLGGTWSSYPKKYQDEFISDIYYAANTYSSRPVASFREKLSLEDEMRINQSAQCHIVGLGLETRPDRINGKEMKEFRRYGVTKVLIGVQSVFDKYLIRVNRRCNVKHTIKAIKLLKNAGFKIQCHIMFDLPQPLKDGVDPRKPIFEVDDIDWSVSVSDDDRKMVDILVTDQRFSFDELKLYPTMTTDHTRIKDEFERGVYVPYGEEKDGKDQLFDNIMYFMERIPPYMRDDRIIRDIPVKDYVVGGTKRGNMGQDIHMALRERGIKCMAIRYREVKKLDIDPALATLMHRVYDGSDGKEHFLSFETPDEQNIFGFLRLRLSDDAGKGVSGVIEFPELVGCAMIRELHIYGQTVAVGSATKKEDSDETAKSAQHVGLGTRLMNEAFRIAQENGYKKISVISGIGVMNYYRRFGFEIEGDNNYMVKHFV